MRKDNVAPAVMGVVLMVAFAAIARPAWGQAAQPAAPEAARIVDVVVEGNQRVDTHRILAQMKLRPGSTYSPEEANEDFKRIYALHEFQNVVITPEPVEGGVRLRVAVSELPLLKSVEFIGARGIKPDRLRSLTGLSEGAALDTHRALSAVPIIVDEYQREGYYFAQASLDREALASGAARFVISEGPRVTVKKVRFEGNATLTSGDLAKQISTKAGFWPFTRGSFSEETLDGDVARLTDTYVSHGFFDAKVSRKFDFDSRNEKVTVTFIIQEGSRYRVAAVSMRGLQTLSAAYLAERLKLKPGEFYSADAMRSDTQTLLDAYGRIGYVHATVEAKVEFTAQAGQVDVVFLVAEGPKIIIGEILITGNKVTRDKVILRELHLEPEDVADATEIRQARERLERSQLFGSVAIDLLPTDKPDVENLSVNVEEGHTAQFIIGAGVSSNSGLIGNIMLVQKNFDASRWPRGWNDPSGFKGAGQTLRLVLEPGTERQQYSLGFTDPYFMDRPIRMDASGSYYTREWDDYDERRLGGQISFGKDVARDLYASLGLRMEAINIANVDAGAPRDVHRVEGSSYLSSVELSVVRDKTDNVFVPTTGSRVGATVEQAGALGGNYTFTRFIVDGKRYWTVTEDNLGRRSVFSLKGRTGFAVGGPPIFERFYAGGQGSLRGFSYRGVGPRENDDPIGGDFLLLMSGEYQFPIVGRNLAGVFFVDAGTVEKTASISRLRAAAGFGVRFTVNMFGAPVPFALDFGFPLAKQGGDDTEVFSFSIAWSF